MANFAVADSPIEAASPDLQQPTCYFDGNGDFKRGFQSLQAAGGSLVRGPGSGASAVLACTCQRRC